MLATKVNATDAVVTLAANVKWQPNLAGFADGADDVFGVGNAGTATQIQALPGDTALGGIDLIKSLTYGNTLILAKTYSLDNELTRLKVSNGATVIVDRTYARTGLTNLTGITDVVAAANNETLTYTDQSHLSGATSAVSLYGTRLWTYDANGNRLTETANGTLNSYTYPANNNRLSTVKQGATTTRAAALRLRSGRSSLEKPNRWLFVCCASRSSPYDAAGTTTQDLRGATAYNYAVNNAGRIKTLTIGTTLKATWTYDGFQKLRIKAATSPAATTHYIWDSFGHIIAEHNGTGGAALRQYIWLGDTPLAVFDNTTLYYVHPNHLDRPVVMTNATAMTIAWQAKYDPFGNPVAVTVSPVNNQRLPGQWFQSEDGLAYNWHRTYDPTLGRYTQADPLGFVDGPSLYGYAGQSPVIGVDPSGLHSPEMKLPQFKWPAPKLYSPITWNPIIQACWQRYLSTPPDDDGLEIPAFLKRTSEPLPPMSKRPPNCDHVYYGVDRPTCNAITKSRGPIAGARCWASAGQRYEACLAGHPMPPLDSWNN